MTSHSSSDLRPQGDCIRSLVFIPCWAQMLSENPQYIEYSLLVSEYPWSLRVLGLCVIGSSVGSLKRESFLCCPSKRLHCIFLYSINICWISAGYTQSNLLGSLGDTEMSPTWILLSSCSHSNRGERVMKAKSQSTRFKVQDNQSLKS